MHDQLALHLMVDCTPYWIWIWSNTELSSVVEYAAQGWECAALPMVWRAAETEK